MEPRSKAVPLDRLAAKADRPTAQQQKSRTTVTPPEKALQRELRALSTKLSGAARDVTEALEGKFPGDLERRYTAGETDAYVMHLHEQRSKRLQKQLLKRYEQDQNVRIRIDSYIRLFERLLDLLSDVPRAAELTDGVLESEAGDVYKLLAVAAGRLEA